MRIAIIKSNFSHYGGAEKYTVKLIGAFLEAGAQVDVLTSVHGNWEGSQFGFRQIPLRQSRYNNLLKLLTFNLSAGRYLKRENYDCILGMDRTDYQTHLRAGGGCHAAWIKRRCDGSSALRCLSFRTNPFHKAVISMEKRAFSSNTLKRIFCNSDLVGREIAYYYPGTENKITTVHNGVEWEEFSEAFEAGLSRRDLIARNMGLDADKFYFLFIGSGYERKGLMKALGAMGLLPEYVELIVVGKDKNERRYSTFCERTGLSQRVHFFGPRKDVVPFLQVSEAFVLPTIYDPFSNASLEALAMGLYTVTSEANGCSEVIREGAGSVIRDLKDIDCVGEAMKTALANRLPKREVRETVKHLDFETQLGKIVDFCIADAIGSGEAATLCGKDKC